jgi:Ca2+/Na+ antiporter
MLIIPALAGFIGAAVLRQVQPPPPIPVQLETLAAPALFILAAVLAVAAPILVRALFAHQQRDLRRVSQTELFKFERRLLFMAMSVPYLALTAYTLQLPRFHLAGTLLMALYAVYYYYPSTRRVALDKRIYRTADRVMSNPQVRVSEKK